MNLIVRRAVALIAAGVAAMTMSACSSSGGKQEQKAATDVGPHRTIAMITSSKPGDTFWDIVRKGAETAAAKDNATLVYSSDPEAGKQAQLVQQAIDQKVDGIVVDLAKPEALQGVVHQATAAGIPVVSINAGETVWSKLGAIAHIGQDERAAGELAGKQLSQTHAKNALCVIHAQGSISHEDRCAGVKRTFQGPVENLYVPGEDMSQVKSSITAKLQASPNLDAVLALGAPVAMTALQSVADAGSQAKVATFDMNKAALQALQDGKLAFVVDQQPFLEGYLGVDQVWLYRKNANVIGAGQQQVLTGPTILTKDNAATVAPLAAQGTR